MQCGNRFPEGDPFGLACMQPLITRRSPDLGVLHLCPRCDGDAANPNLTNPRNNPPTATTKEADAS